MIEKVSVVVPVYNTEQDMLIKCFDSILSQTYKNIELVIVDDGSRVETAQICDDYSRTHKDFDIRVLHISNGGVSVARNTGIESSTGSYLTFVDADDWVDNDYIEKMYNNIIELDADIALCSRIFEYRTKSVENHFLSHDIVFDKTNKRDLIRKSITTGIAGTWCKLYKRVFIDKHNLRYDCHLRRTQDVIFNLYAFQYAERISYFDYCSYHYRMQNASVTKKYSSNADVILTLAAEEFEKYANIFYPKDVNIMQDTHYKCLIILNEILKLKFFNPEYCEDRVIKFAGVEKLCSTKVYTDSIQSINRNRLSFLMKFRVYCLRRKTYSLLEMMYRFQIIIERRRNYG